MEKIIEHFQAIAKKENADFLLNDKDVPVAELGVRSPHAVLFLKLYYKDNLITIRNSIGTEFVANTYCEIKSSSLRGDFEITTREKIFRVFKNKNKPFKLKIKDPKLERRLNDNVALTNLKEYANMTRFEPYIEAKSERNRTEIRMNYHLLFDDWEKMVEPVIEFYKSLIDEYSY